MVKHALRDDLYRKTGPPGVHLDKPIAPPVFERKIAARRFEGGPAEEGAPRGAIRGITGPGPPALFAEFVNDPAEDAGRLLFCRLGEEKLEKIAIYRRLIPVLRPDKIKSIA
jgi:hypothetical protein